MGGGCEGKSAGKPPVIHQYFAAKELRSGDSWKVYLQASAPEGDMKTIVCTIDQAGSGTYPVSLTRIPEDQKKELSGYIYLTTFQSQGLNYLTLSLTVQVQDQGGNYSLPISFPLRFNPLANPEMPREGIFREKDLGPILIHLVPLQPSAA